MLRIVKYTGVMMKSKTDYRCPSCDTDNAFFMRPPEECPLCKFPLPPMNKLIESKATRQLWHFLKPIVE